MYFTGLEMQIITLLTFAKILPLNQNVHETIHNKLRCVVNDNNYIENTHRPLNVF